MFISENRAYLPEILGLCAFELIEFAGNCRAGSPARRHPNREPPGVNRGPSYREVTSTRRARPATRSTYSRLSSRIERDRLAARAEAGAF
jgi:hypothetical protein